MIFVLSGTLLFIGLFSLTYSYFCTRLDQKTYPPIGDLVNIGDHKLHVIRTGTGTPTVVLESGSGNFSLDWHPLINRIGQFSTVIAYDRSGHGWSEPSSRAGSMSAVITELHDLLQLIEGHAPIILVGHSLGGLYAQFFARRFPGKVAGMVLIDASHPDIYPLMSETSLHENKRRLFKLQFAALFSLFRMKVVKAPKAPPKLPEETRKTIETLWLHPQFWQALINQSQFLDSTVSEVFAAEGPFPDIPLVVISPPNAEWAVSLGEDMPTLWLQFQQKLARLSDKGRLIHAKRSGHMVHHDEPELVLSAIQDIIETIQEAKNNPSELTTSTG